ncbi:diacylglycerol/lipid kinase family protein [Flavitalea flava]
MQGNTRRIIYLINPISGTRGKSGLQELITRKTEERQIDFRILPTNAEGDYSFLLSLIEEEKFTDIVVCGGDGTVSSVATALTGTNIPVGIIPMGSGNGLAFAAGIPKDPARALDIIFSGNSSLVDGFRINDQFSCMLCGIGFDAAVAHTFSLQKKRGLKTYIRVSVNHFFSARPRLFRIRLPHGVVGGQDFPVEAFFINIANGNQFGNHFTIAPKASLHDGLLDIVVVRKMNKISLFFSILRQVVGGNPVQDIPDHAGKNRILYFQTPELIIENPSEAPFHIDGDPKATAKEFVIRIIPGAFRLIRP